MTTLHLTPPAVAHEVTAEQVVAYLIAKGWEERRRDHGWRVFRRGARIIEAPGDVEWHHTASVLTDVIAEIARLESRHPTAVLASILGPAVGVSGVGCGGESWARAACSAKMGGYRIGAAPSAPEEE